MEALALELARSMPMRAIARSLNVDDMWLWRVVEALRGSGGRTDGLQHGPPHWPRRSSGISGLGARSLL